MFEEFIENLAILIAIVFIAWLIRINFQVVPCGTYVLDNHAYVEMRQGDNVLISIPVECK